MSKQPKSRTVIVGDMILGKGWHTATDIANLIGVTRQQAASAMYGLECSNAYEVKKERINKKAMIRVISHVDIKKTVKLTSTGLLNQIIFNGV